MRPMLRIRNLNFKQYQEIKYSIESSGYYEDGEMDQLHVVSNLSLEGWNGKRRDEKDGRTDLVLTAEAFNDREDQIRNAIKKFKSKYRGKSLVFETNVWRKV